MPTPPPSSPPPGSPNGPTQDRLAPSRPAPPTPSGPPAWSLPGPGGPDPRRRRLVAGGIAGVLLLAGGAVLAVVSGATSGAGGYRTAVASTEDVVRRLDTVGTVEPVDGAAVAFPVAGTVANVAVAAGSEVSVGQVLATLDATELEAALHEAEETLAQAELTLERVIAGDAAALASPNGSGGTGTSATGATPISAGASVTSATSSDTSATGAHATTASLTTLATEADTMTTVATGTAEDGDLVAARQAVADAQHVLDLDLAAAEVALTTATTVCVGTVEGTTTTTDGDAGDSTDACRAALHSSLAAQQLVATDEVAVADAIADLEALVARSDTTGQGGDDRNQAPATDSGNDDPAAGTGAGSQAEPVGGGGDGTGSAPGTGSDTSTAATATVSAADIVAAQKAVDAAAAQVAVAEQAVAQSTVVSPVEGTVTAVGMAVGDTVEAGSSTAVVQIAGSGGYEVTTSVAVTDLPFVEIGEDAVVVPDGSTEELTGSVVQIGLLPTTSTTGSDTTYAVVVGLDDPSAELLDGGLASVQIVTSSVHAATAVPTSAVTTTEAGRTVTVLDGGQVSVVEVEIGTVGSTWTEVTDGVVPGTVVVLADLSEPLPGGATDGTTESGDGGTGTFSPPEGVELPAGGGRPGG